jgi:hypothetical protein
LQEKLFVGLRKHIPQQIKAFANGEDANSNPTKPTAQEIAK